MIMLVADMLQNHNKHVLKVFLVTIIFISRGILNVPHNILAHLGRNEQKCENVIILGLLKTLLLYMEDYGANCYDEINS